MSQQIFFSAMWSSVNVYVTVQLCLLWTIEVSLVGPSKVQEIANSVSSLNICTCGELCSGNIYQDVKICNCSFSNWKSFTSNLPVGTEVLNLRGNTIASIPDSVQGLQNLVELDLSGNSIKACERGVFCDMSHIIYLNIGKNKISAIFRICFRGLTSLEHLNLSKNTISYVDDKTLEDLQNLLSLDLGHNLLGSVYAEWFHGLTKLIKLDLSHNKIHSIAASVFWSLVSLESLNLTGNRISFVDPRAFSGLLNLKVLNLEDNRLSCTPTAAFQSLPALEILTLDKNPLVKIKPLDFSHLPVTRISLSQMPELIIIDAKAFYNLINISSILIHNNDRLSYVDPLAFINVDTLAELHLHYNNLVGLQNEIQRYLPIGVSLTLHGNPLRCDCNSRWLYQSLSQGDCANIVINEPEYLKCFTPLKFREILLKDIEISNLPKKCSPIMLYLRKSNVLVGKVGERQVIECRALGSPIPQLHWILPDGSVVNSTLNEVRRRFFPPGTLVYYFLDPQDSGEYTCMAQNSEGSASSVIRFNVTGNEIQLFPSHVSPTCITLSWNGTENHVFRTLKIVYHQLSSNGSDTERFSIESPKQKIFTIRNLYPATGYQFCIGYEVVTGYWLQISCCEVTTPKAELINRTYQRSSFIKVGVFEAIIAFFLLLGICLASSLSRTSRRRFKEFPQRTKSNIHNDHYDFRQPIITIS